jgi:HrpA-like RNA helicase
MGLHMAEVLSHDLAMEVLQSCIEPPDTTTIGRSFESLYKSNFITTPDDMCEITTLGAFVSALGVELTLRSLVGLGIQMGVGAEAIQMAAIFSFPRTPWMMSSTSARMYSSASLQQSHIFVSLIPFRRSLSWIERIQRYVRHC